ncbi:MAG: response regulator [Nevskiales bacterium]
MPELNVLVVDDSSTARFAMRKYLEHLHNLVQTAASAMEAYDYLKDHQPDVIFLDNVMPEISGLEALYTLKHDAKTAVIPVIFCTSIGRTEFIERARASGALQVLHKPPSLDQLSRVLADIQAQPTPAPASRPVASTTPAANDQPEAQGPGGQRATAAADLLPPEAAGGRYAELRGQIDTGMDCPRSDRHSRPMI